MEKDIFGTPINNPVLVGIEIENVAFGVYFKGTITVDQDNVARLMSNPWKYLDLIRNESELV